MYLWYDHALASKMPAGGSALLAQQPGQQLSTTLTFFVICQYVHDLQHGCTFQADCMCEEHCVSCLVVPALQQTASVVPHASNTAQENQSCGC